MERNIVMVKQNKRVEMHANYLVLCENYAHCTYDKGMCLHKRPHYTSHVRCRCEAVGCTLPASEKEFLCIKYERGNNGI